LISEILVPDRGPTWSIARQTLANLLQQEKEYSKQLSQLLESSNASLASFTAYAAASPPPGSHVIMSVAGSLAGIDEVLKRYAQGVDEWRETMRSLKDAEEEVGNIMRDRKILCVVFLIFFSCRIFFFFSESLG
jgi:predicted secreted protein